MRTDATCGVSTATMTTLDQLTHHDFLPHLNSTFIIHYSADDSFEAILKDVSTLGTRPENRRWPFALVLQTPFNDRYLNQAIYRIEHAEIGTMDLFLVPNGPDGEAFNYEVVFT